jgi:hypothetical protein
VRWQGDLLLLPLSILSLLYVGGVDVRRWCWWWQVDVVAASGDAGG